MFLSALLSASSKLRSKSNTACSFCSLSASRSPISSVSLAFPFLLPLPPQSLHRKFHLLGTPQVWGTTWYKQSANTMQTNAATQSITRHMVISEFISWKPVMQCSQPHFQEMKQIRREKVKDGIGIRNQSISFGAEQMVRLKALATVVNHTAIVQPTIVAVWDLFKKTLTKNASETWARPHPNRIATRSHTFVSENTCNLNIFPPNNMKRIAVAQQKPRLNRQLTIQQLDILSPLIFMFSISLVSFSSTIWYTNTGSAMLMQIGSTIRQMRESPRWIWASKLGVKGKNCTPPMTVVSLKRVRMQAQLITSAMVSAPSIDLRLLYVTLLSLSNTPILVIPLLRWYCQYFKSLSQRLQLSFFLLACLILQAPSGRLSSSGKVASRLPKSRFTPANDFTVLARYIAISSSLKRSVVNSLKKPRCAFRQACQWSSGGSRAGLRCSRRTHGLPEWQSLQIHTYTIGRKC
ncbi:hypothetical protein FGO68_gene17122 [Halteria grandinella]|uniref:Uncharacterized protein n=1 Tax=Halteria grandinella TaxID=5974 RepID=A0A8J8P0H0_HALGN|nr:hypothetical protein FGO68_gene17122 [Halteria grandinella]